MKRFWLVLCLMSLVIGACSTSSTTPSPSRNIPATIIPMPQAPLSPLPSMFPKVDRRPAPLTWLRRVVMTEVPVYDPDHDRMFGEDLRARILSDLDLTNSLDALLHASFDSQTTWPPADKMPPGFDPQRVMELGTDPGLGIRHLHEQGITGRGVGIAIVDQTLLVDHQEYAGQLRLYEEVAYASGQRVEKMGEAQMHGPAVASIAVGQTAGVAPGADLYYVASSMCLDNYELDYACVARGVYRILEVNDLLPVDRKIRVLSMSLGWEPESKGYREIDAAVQEARSAGMLVICSSVEEVHGFKFQGLGRVPLAPPNGFDSYEPGLSWAQGFYDSRQFPDRLLVPMDSRTTAGPEGVDQYVFYRVGGWSWSIPYIAGMYALAAQVKPSITPDEFWTLALQTGRTIELQHEGQAFSLGPILDPAALIAVLQGVAG